MAGLPTGYAATILDTITGRGVSTVYLALCNADPGDSPTMASLSEDPTSGYARQVAAWTVPSGDPEQTSNTSLITFGPYTANQALPITHVVLVTSSSGTGGTVKFAWALDSSVAALNTQTLQIPPNALILVQ